MIGIVTALKCEAGPLIRYFGLNKNPWKREFPIFRSRDMILIISGTGKIRSAAAIAYLLKQITEPQKGVYLNIGICGAMNRERIGELYYIKKVTDAETGRSYFPAIELHPPFPEAVLTTVNRPPTQPLPADETFTLVDMEAAGFFETASRLLPGGQRFCLKIVSDHLENTRLSRSFVSGLIEQNLPKVDAFFLEQGMQSKR